VYAWGNGVSEHPRQLNFDRSTVKRALQNTQNDCQQWLSDTKFVFGAPDPAESAYLQRSPRPPSWFKGRPTSKGRREKVKGKKCVGERREGTGKGQGREGRRGGWEWEWGKESRNTPSINSCVRPCLNKYWIGITSSRSLSDSNCIY